MLEWHNDAACVGMELDSFFESYIEEEAIFVDKICAACPVIKQCYKDGMRKDSYGVWGGFYLINGFISKERNEHKTPAVWNELLLILTSDW